MKASMAHAAIYGPKFKDPQWSDVRYDSLAKEGHNSNVWAYACINAIATSASTVPLLLYQTGGKNKKQIEQHPLLDLLKKPNDISENTDSKWTRIISAVDKGVISANEGREELGFSPRKDGDNLREPKPTGAGQDGAGDPPPDPKGYGRREIEHTPF